MKTAVILHSISDAKHCVENKIYEGNLLFSTHSSVDVYLEEKHGLDCRCLSGFMSIEELMGKRKACVGTVEGLLKDLDSDLSPLLNKEFNLNLNYFTPLYFCHCYLQLLGYTSFVDCVKRAKDIHKLEKILFYDYRFNTYLSVRTSVKDLVPLFFGDIETEVIKVPEDKGAGETKVNFKKILNVAGKLKIGDFGFIFDRISTAINKYSFRRFSNGKKTILVSEPLYELEFLIGRLRKYNVLFYDLKKERFLGFEKKSPACPIKLDFGDSSSIKNHADPFVKVLLRDIEEDFTNNASRYISAVCLVEKISAKYPISLGIWGGSPAWATRAMIFKYLSSKGIKIIGSQHGCLYGEIYHTWSFETDFNRCDHFISWGFTREDLQRIYPSKKINVEILPLGKTKIVKKGKASKKIDFLFPITMSISMLESGMDRIPPERLTERQILLLEHLNSFKSEDIYIKPFIGSGYQNCSAWSALERLDNLKVVDNVSLTDFLLDHSPKAVLIEVPSQPLFDVLPLDTEIFLMDDPVNPYEKRALEELKKRVHYCEDVAEVIAKIDLFMKGKLEKKRDNTFYEHYMCKERTEEKILNLIDSLVMR